MTVRTVHLHGRAAELFGDFFRLDVSTLAEAVQAIAVQIPGFRQFLTQNNFHCVRGPTVDEGMFLDEELLHFRLGKADLHIMPVIEGSGGGKGGGIGKIIAGVLLAGVAFWATPALLAAAGVTQGNLLVMGLGLAITGVASLMSAQPGKEEKSDSFSFGNTLQTATQGDPVPIIIGHVFHRSPKVISASIEASDIAVEGGSGGGK